MSKKPDYNATPIFVFGSNLRGRHGKGAALFAAQNFKAKEGVGFGFSGQSFAIPTKDEYIKTLPLTDIVDYVNGFLKYARENQDKTFVVTRIGCGLAGYKDEDIAPLFLNAPSNCIVPGKFLPILEEMSDSGIRTVRCVIAGSRTVTDFNFIQTKLDLLFSNMPLETHKIEIISGMANGVDTLSEKYAAMHGFKVIPFPAEWGRLQKRAGHVRNNLMASVATHGVVFWDGVSPGSKNMIDLLQKESVPHKVIIYKKATSKISI